jgi:hypothetical protein
MFGITLKRSAATLGVVAGLLAAAAPASAAVGVRENGSQGALVHITDGTSNTMIFGEARTLDG